MWVLAMDGMGIQAMVESFLGNSMGASISLGNLALSCRALSGLHYDEIEVVVWEAPDTSIFITDRQVMPFSRTSISPTPASCGASRLTRGSSIITNGRKKLGQTSWLVQRTGLIDI